MSEPHYPTTSNEDMEPVQSDSIRELSPGLNSKIGSVSILNTITIDGAPESNEHDDLVALYLPELLPLLGHIESLHKHKYDDGFSIYDKLKEAEKLQDDMDEISRYTTTSLFKFVYSPEELHELVGIFNKFSKKNRPDFNELEGQLLDIAVRAKSVNGLPKNISGLVSRERNDSPGRRGMNWDTMIRLSQFCSSVLRESLNSSDERQEYIIKVTDPESDNLVDLTSVYQFIADNFAVNCLSERANTVSRARKNTFVENCEVINEWYEENRGLLENLPLQIKIRKDNSMVRASSHIESLIRIMNERLTGKSIRGGSKYYEYDPGGAISLQKKIGHVINDINRQLQLLQEPNSEEDEIIPLD